MRKLLAPLRSLSTLLVVASLFAFSAEIVSMPKHGLDHSVQAAKLQHSKGDATPAFTTDGCDACHAYSLVSGFETFLPEVVATFTSQPLEKTASHRSLQTSFVVLPPVRGPPARA